MYSSMPAMCRRRGIQWHGHHRGPPKKSTYVRTPFFQLRIIFDRRPVEGPHLGGFHIYNFWHITPELAIQCTRMCCLFSQCVAIPIWGVSQCRYALFSNPSFYPATASQLQGTSDPALCPKYSVACSRLVIGSTFNEGSDLDFEQEPLVDVVVLILSKVESKSLRHWFWDGFGAWRPQPWWW